MQPETVYAALKQIFSESVFPDVIAALRQDPIIWDNLFDPAQIEKLSSLTDNDPQDWSPASLALLALDIPVKAAALQGVPLLPLDPEIRQVAARVYEDTFRNLKSPANLAEAGLLALALRERRRLTDTWQGLLSELQINPAATFEIQLQVWRTPLACLYALTPDPLSLLQAIAPRPGSRLHPAQIALVLHAPLSNPLTIHEQVSLLSTLIAPYSPEEQSQWINAIEATGRKNLTVSLAQELLQGPTSHGLKKSIDRTFSDPDSPQYPQAVLEAILARQQLAGLRKIAGKSATAIPLLEETRDALRKIQASVSIQLGEAALEANNSDTALAAFEQAVELAPELPGPRVELALIYAESGRHADGLNILPEKSTNPGINLAKAILFQRTGDIVNAQEHARQSLQSIDEIQAKGLPQENSGTWRKPSSWVKTLLTLGLIDESIQVANSHLKTRPVDCDLLEALSNSLTARRDLTAAGETAQTIVLLQPQNPDYRRLYAGILEGQENWLAALGERVKVNQQLDKVSTADFLALARCSIQAEQIDPAVRACQAVLNQDPDNGMAHIYLGETCRLAKDSLGALQHFTQATLLAPDQPQAWLALSRLQRESGDAYKALETLRAGAHTAPQSSEIQFALAEEYLCSGSPSEALPALRRANTLDPESQPISLRLGEILRDLGHLTESRQVLEQARKHSPTQPDLAYAHSKTLLALGETQAAIPALLATLEAQPKDVEPYLVYARLMSGCETTPKNPQAFRIFPKNNLDRSKLQDALRKAIEIQPEHVEARLLLAEALMENKQFEESQSLFEELAEEPGIQISDWNWRVKLGLGKTSLSLNNHEAALAAIHEAAAARPNDYMVQQVLSEALWTVNLRQQALEAARRALSLAPQDQNNLVWYAHFTYALGSHAECITALERAVELDPTQADINLSLIRVQIEANNLPSARDVLETLLGSEALSPATLRSAAYLWLALEDTSSAITSLQRAIDLNTDPSSDLWLELSILLAKDGQIENALEAIQKAILIDPSDARFMDTQADLLVRLSRNQAAIACLEQSLQLCGAHSELITQNQAPISNTSLDGVTSPSIFRVQVDPVIIHLKIARLQRSQGEVSAALTHAEKAVELAPLSLAGHALAAELAFALLDNEPARKLTVVSFEETGRAFSSGWQTLPIHALTDQNPDAGVDLICIRAEIELEAGDIHQAEKILAQAVDLAPKSPRVLAIQARIQSSYGDLKLAEQSWEAAVGNLNASARGAQVSSSWPFYPNSINEEGSVNSTSALQADYTQYPTLTMAQAALDLEQWDIALALFNQAARNAPMEPRTHLFLARALVLCAEKQRTFQSVNVTLHLPGPDKLSEANFQVFEKAVLAANRLSQSPEITRWHKRGQAAFHPGQPAFRLIASLPANPDDIAATVAVCREMKDLDQALQLAAGFIEHPEVRFQVALLQRDLSMKEAFSTALFLLENEAAHPVHLALYADLALSMGEITSGLQAVETALDLWPNEPEWHILAARLDETSQNWASAAAHCQKAYYLDPENPAYALALGKANLYSGHIKEAIQALDTATRLDANQPAAWMVLARAYQAASDPLRAIASAEKAISLSPNQVEPLLLCGEIALQASQVDLVHQHAESALRLEPANPYALLLLVRSLAIEGEPTEALEAINQFLPSASNPYPLKIERVALIRQIQGPQATLQALQDLSFEYPDDPVILGQLAEAMADCGQRDLAEKTAQAALKLRPDQPELHLLVGRIQRTTGQLDQAIYHLTEAVQQAPGNVEAYLELGRAHQDRREHSQSLQIYKKAIQVAARDPRPYYQAGLVLKESKDYMGAESMLRHAADLAPEDLNVRRQLGAIIALNLVHNPQEASV